MTDETPEEQATPDTQVEETAAPDAAPQEAPETTPTPEAPPVPDTTEEPASEPQVVPTALNPDTWPDSNQGTVTDPEILRQHGMPVPTETTDEPASPEVSAPAVTTPDSSVPDPASSTVNESSTSTPPVVSEKPSAEAEIFVCLMEGGRPKIGCAPFWSDAHISGSQVVCPNCGNTSVIRQEGVAS